MKKLLLIGLALCFMVPMMAQMPQENKSRKLAETYTEILDSIDGGWYKYCYTYDAQYNIKIMEMRMYGSSYYLEFFYDDQNRLDSIKLTNGNPAYYNLLEFVYDDMGRRSEILSYDYLNGSIRSEDKEVYQYDENNNVSVITISYFLGLEEWVDDIRTVFIYNDQFDIDEMVSYNNGTGMWVLDTKTVYIYDDQHNCKITKQYYYDGDEWCFENETCYYYDLNVPSSRIAGLDFSFYNNYYVNGDNKFCRNKLLYGEDSRKRDGQSVRTQTTYYYSEITGTAEMPDVLLNIWPNPVEEVLHWETEGFQKAEILTIDGKQIMTVEKDLESVNVSGLAVGCYLLKATMNNGSVITQKFLKQ